MEKIEFDCSVEGWPKEYGTLRLISEKAPYEAIADLRSYHYHFIYGKYRDGYYISIPEWYIGCPMSHYKDISWNKEYLISAGMDAKSASTVATAISYLRKAYQKNRNDPVNPVLKESKAKARIGSVYEPNV